MGDRRPYLQNVLVQWALVAILTVLAYAPSVTGGFLLDDHPLVENNPAIQHLKPLWHYFLQEDGVVDPAQWQTDYHTGYYRPLVSLSYALDYRLWGNRPAGFRITNLILHLAVCLILLVMLRRLGPKSGYPMAAVLIFALHPVNTEAVAWISSRNNLMATLFSLLSLHFYGNRSPAQSGWRLPLSLFCFALALLSKEYGVMVLPILFVWNRTMGAGRRSRWSELAGYFPYAAVLLGYFWIRTSVTGAMLSPHGNPEFFLRLVMAPYLILYNLRLIILPVGLHSFSVVYPTQGIWLEAGLGLAGLALIGGLLWRFRRNRPFVMGTLAFLLGLFPVLNIVPTSAVSLVSMRWLYFPLAFLGFAWALPAMSARWRTAGAALAVLLVAGLGGYTFFLNRYHWHDDAGFYKREVTVFNNLAYAGGLAESLHDSGDPARAEVYYRMGIAARPDLVENYINYAALLVDTGRPGPALAVLDSIADRFMSRENQGRLANNRAMAMARLGRLSEAKRQLRKAVTAAPREPSFWSNLGSVCAMNGDLAGAIEAMEQGLALAPESPGLLANLALARLSQKDVEGAAAAFDRLPESEKRKRPELAARIRAERSAPRSVGASP